MALTLIAPYVSRAILQASKDVYYRMDTTSTKLLNKLKHIAELEKLYGIRGVGLLVRPGDQVTLSDSTDYVLGFIEKAVHMIHHRDELPMAEPTPSDLQP